MKNEWQVEIKDDFRSLDKIVTIYFDRPDGSHDVINADGSIQNVLPGKDIIPTLRVRREALQALFDEMSRKGMKAPEKSHLEGKLEATEKHLSDVQSILLAALPSALRSRENKK